MKKIVNPQSDALNESNEHQTKTLTLSFVQFGQRHMELWWWKIFVAITKISKIGQMQRNKPHHRE